MGAGGAAVGGLSVGGRVGAGGGAEVGAGGADVGAGGATVGTVPVSQTHKSAGQ